MKKKVQKAGFLRSTTPISWKPPHTSEGKGKEEKKEREGRKQENRKIAMAGLTFSSYMMVTSIWRKFLAEKKYTFFKGRGLFGGDVFKNPGRCIFFRLFCILVCFQRQCTCYETVGGELSFPADPGLKTYLQSSVTQAMIKRLLQQI